MYAKDERYWPNQVFGNNADIIKKRLSMNAEERRLDIRELIVISEDFFEEYDDFDLNLDRVMKTLVDDNKSIVVILTEDKKEFLLGRTGIESLSLSNIKIIELKSIENEMHFSEVLDFVAECQEIYFQPIL